jgi:hypothetical protein
MGINKRRASELASEFWSNIDRRRGLCDTCNTILYSGEGYLSNPGPGHGRSPDLLCEECFDRCTWAAAYSGPIPRQDPLGRIIEEFTLRDSIGVVEAISAYGKYAKRPRYELTYVDIILAIVEGYRMQGHSIDRVFCYRAVAVNYAEEVRLRCGRDDSSSSMPNSVDAREIKLIFKDSKVLDDAIPQYLKTAMQAALQISDDELKGMLTSTDIAEVKAACQLIAKSKNQRFGHLLVTQLHDPRKNDMIAWAIAEIGFQSAVPHLIDVLAKSLRMEFPSDAHAEWIAQALQKLGGSRAIDVLVDFVAHPNALDKQLVDTTLFHLDRKRAISRLRRAWKDGKSDKVHVFQALKALGCPPPDAMPTAMNPPAPKKSSWFRRLVRW